jgi:hypothetical protein
MSQNWRGDPAEQMAMSRWLRDRWKYGSVYVLDIDRMICDPAGDRGLLIEEKHDSATDKTWTITSKLAARLGFYAALFVYSTDDGTPTGTVTRIDATIRSPAGDLLERPDLDFEWFDNWICKRFGAERRPATSPQDPYVDF